MSNDGKELPGQKKADWYDCSKMHDYSDILVSRLPVKPIAINDLISREDAINVKVLCSCASKAEDCTAENDPERKVVASMEAERSIYLANKPDECIVVVILGKVVVEGHFVEERVKIKVVWT